MERKANVRLLTVEQVREKLKDRRLTYVAKECGLTYMSLARIKKNSGNPSLATLQKLSEYFSDEPVDDLKFHQTTKIEPEEGTQLKSYSQEDESPSSRSFQNTILAADEDQADGYVELTIDQWKLVIETARTYDKSDLHMYLLTSWANQQVVTAASICAFTGQVVKEAKDRQTASSAISSISKLVRSATGNPKATCYLWNSIRGEWTIGVYQTISLRKAFGTTRLPSGSNGE